MIFFLVLFLFFIFDIQGQNIIHVENEKRIFAKPMEIITLDVLMGSDITVYLEDLERNMDYVVTLSYPGVFPVQYTVYLEKDDEEDSSSLDTKRRIQDTRLFSFQTNEIGDIVKMDENGEIIHYLPILHIQPHHVIDKIDTIDHRYVAIVIEPLTNHITPTILSEICFLFTFSFLVISCILCYYHNESFKKFIQSILCISQQKED